MHEISSSDITHPELDGETRGTVYEIETADKAKAYALVLESVNDFWLPKDWPSHQELEER